MNAQKLTEKSLEAIQSANDMAISHQNQMIQQVHLLCALLEQENEEDKCKKLQEEANEKTAQMLREAAADTLDKVLYELSGQMKNAYARSDE